MGFEKFIQKTVFIPLKMKNSSFVWQDSFEKSKVYDHDALGAVTDRRKDTTPNAAASLHTTAEDYAKLVIALLKGTGLKKKTQRQMLMSQVKIKKEDFPNLSWGLGIGLEEYPNGNSFWHWGDNGNNKSFVIANTKTKNGVLFFTNGSNGLSFVKEILAEGIGGEENSSIKWLDYERFDSPSRVLFKEIVDEGVDSALNNYRQKRREDSKNGLSEAAMNRLGYQLLFMKKKPEAVGVFEQNVRDFPDSANAWDSFAEGQMLVGKKDLAIKYYKKSLELDPKNENAEKKIKELQGN
jgi:CubicO group peptidase (beta-lactamase class C family)